MAIAHDSHLYEKLGGRISPQSYFRAIDSKHARVATRRATAAVTLMPGRKPSSINRVAKSAGRSMLSITAGFTLAKIGKPAEPRLQSRLRRRPC